MAVNERIRRALAGVSDHVSAVIGPVSQQYGEAFGCEPWAVQLFPEEVVRGGPAFAVSLVLSSMEPHMRKAAELGAWQVISPSPCMGRLEVVPDLHSIQEKVYEQPTILLAKHVSGEEEVPAGVVGLIRWVGGGEMAVAQGYRSGGAVLLSWRHCGRVHHAGAICPICLPPVPASLLTALLPACPPLPSSCLLPAPSCLQRRDLRRAVPPERAVPQHGRPLCLLLRRGAARGGGAPGWQAAGL